MISTRDGVDLDQNESTEEKENVEHSKGSHVGNKYLTLELLT